MTREEQGHPTDDAPIVGLRPTGDGKTLYRTLARVLVRRELVLMGAISMPETDCEHTVAAG